MHVQRFTAFALGDIGGNPAGVVVAEQLPDDVEMQRTAAEVGYSETAFAAPNADGWEVRYFAPACEIPFCGHATIALGAALALAHGNGRFPLRLRDGTRIVVEGSANGGTLSAALESPPTHSRPAPAELVSRALAVFGYAEADLDPRLPPAVIEAGATHLILPLSTRERLRDMAYDLDVGRALMRDGSLTTVGLIVADGTQRFHARHPFAAGGVYEDPATGAAAAAFAGYLRDVAWPHGGTIEILQGEDMGMPSRLAVSIGPAKGSGVRVSGAVRRID